MSGCSPAPLAEPGMPSFDVVELRSSQPGDCDGEERGEGRCELCSVFHPPGPGRAGRAQCGQEYPNYYNKLAQQLSVWFEILQPSPVLIN